MQSISLDDRVGGLSRELVERVLRELGRRSDHEAVARPRHRAQRRARLPVGDDVGLLAALVAMRSGRPVDVPRADGLDLRPQHRVAQDPHVVAAAHHRARDAQPGGTAPPASVRANR